MKAQGKRSRVEEAINAKVKQGRAEVEVKSSSAEESKLAQGILK